MANFKIKLYSVLDEKKVIKEYESRVVPEQADHIQLSKNKFLHIEVRIFNANDPEDVKIYGYIDVAG